MANVSVLNMEGKEVGSMELNDAVFGVEINEHLVHQAVVLQLANNRQGTQKAKTRSEVSGGGRKPWRQKEKRAALKSVLTSKVQENKFIVLDELKLAEVKTKEMKKVLDNLKVNNALVIIGDDSENVALSARNIAGVQTASVNTINVFDMLKYNTIIATKSSVASIEEVYA